MNEDQLLKGALDIALLAAIRRRESYGYELVQRIREAGLDRVAEASVYGTLRRLETQRLVRSQLVASKQGPARRYYDLTADGRRRVRTDGHLVDRDHQGRGRVSIDTSWERER